MLANKKKAPKKGVRRKKYSYVNSKGEVCKKVGSLLGQGAFGSTYRMRNKIDRGIYAVKHVDTPVVTEVQTLVKLSHRNIVRYFSCQVRKDKSLWVIMELVGDGTTVKDVLTTLSHSKSRSVFSQVADALEYIHSKHIIHRDLKSTNVFLDGPRVVLGDFGHSVCLEMNNPYTPKPNTNGRSHFVYRAPEVLAGESYGEASDMFQLGCLFLELVTTLTLDDTVGNSSKNGWVNTAKDWLKTQEAQETVEDILETYEDDRFVTVGFKLLAPDPQSRPTAKDVRVSLLHTHAPRTRSNTVAEIIEDNVSSQNTETRPRTA